MPADRSQLLAESEHAFAGSSTDLTELLQVVTRRCAELLGDACHVRLLTGDVASSPPDSTAPSAEACLVAPLRARGRDLGTITIARTEPTEDDEPFLRELADRAALAIDSASLVRELQRRVDAANRELEDFTYSVSHDLRAPLRAIDGFSQILQEDHVASLDDDARRVVGVIRKNTQRMGQLMDDLLRFSRLGRLALSPVLIQMSSVAHAVGDDLRRAEASRRIEITIGDLPPAFGDYGLIREVWANLLQNAVKYTRVRDDAKIVVAGAAHADELRYTVEDNGAGFNAKYSDKLFKVFQRLHDAADYEGTGVGLALVHRIVTRHGGRVWAESSGSGATFGFALPRRSA